MQSYSSQLESPSPGSRQRLPRTTERPARECGDECCEMPRRATPQSHGRKSVVRGLLSLARVLSVQLASEESFTVEDGAGAELTAHLNGR